MTMLPDDEAMKKAAMAAEAEWVRFPTAGDFNEWPDVVAAALRALDAAGYELKPKAKAESDWSNLPRDMYVIEAWRDQDGIFWSAVVCAVPMAVGPEVRYTLAAAPKLFEVKR